MSAKRPKTLTYARVFILLSNRNASKASSPLQLGEVSINLSKSGAQETKYAIDKLRSARSTRDKGLKERLKTFSTNYDSAMYYIKTAIIYWKSGDFGNVARNIAAAVNEAISCRQNFGREGPSEPADVRVGNDKVETLCRVVLVISSGRKACFFS